MSDDQQVALLRSADRQRKAVEAIERRIHGRARRLAARRFFVLLVLTSLLLGAAGSLAFFQFVQPFLYDRDRFYRTIQDLEQREASLLELERKLKAMQAKVDQERTQLDKTIEGQVSEYKKQLSKLKNQLGSLQEEKKNLTSENARLLDDLQYQRKAYQMLYELHDIPKKRADFIGQIARGEGSQKGANFDFLKQKTDFYLELAGYLENLDNSKAATERLTEILGEVNGAISLKNKSGDPAIDRLYDLRGKILEKMGKYAEASAAYAEAARLTKDPSLREKYRGKSERAKIAGAGSFGTSSNR